MRRIMNKDYELPVGSRIAAKVNIKQFEEACEKYKEAHRAERIDDFLSEEDYDELPGYYLASSTPWVDPILDADMMYSYDDENQVDDKPRKYCGLHTLDNGLTYYGWISAGDGDYGVFNIIYFDGENIRMYQPTIGNNVNPKYHSVAGWEGEFAYHDEYPHPNDDDSGEAFYEKYGLDPYTDPFDWEAMINDIKKVIVVK